MLFESIVSSQGKDRIYFIDPYDQIKKGYFQFDALQISNLAKLFRKMQHISEGVASEKIFSTLDKYTSSNLRSMYGRMVVVHLIPDEYLEKTSYTIVQGSTVYFIDMIHMEATIITNPKVAQSMTNLIIGLIHFGKKIDLSHHIKKILSDRGEVV